MKKIYISTDSRGKVSPDGWFSKSAWPFLLKEMLPQFEIDISSWDRILCTYDSILKDCRNTTPRPSLVITQLGQLETCIGPELQKIHWVRTIPPEEGVTIYYYPEKSNDRNAYDTMVNCEHFLRKILHQFNGEFRHLGIPPTRKCCGPDTSRLDMLRNIISTGPYIDLSDLDHNLYTYDGEHYTNEMHKIIANRTYNWIKSHEDCL